jgi:hypothetical protein
MPESDFTQIRVPIIQRDQLKKRALRNFRSIPREIDYLLATVEKLEKQQDLSKLAQPTKES